MKAPDFYLNNYIADELRAAFDKEDVCISYSGDYEPETAGECLLWHQHCGEWGSDLRGSGSGDV